MFAYLNGIEETSIAARTPEDTATTGEILARIAAIDASTHASSPEVEAAFAKWHEDMLALPRTGWRALELYQFGDSGQKCWPQPDKSVINMGYANTRGSETFTSSLEIPEIRAVRLEVMNDPYLPMNGPGRSTRGTGALSEFVLHAGSDPAQLAFAKMVCQRQRSRDPARPAAFSLRSGTQARRPQHRPRRARP